MRVHGLREGGGPCDTLGRPHAPPAHYSRHPGSKKHGVLLQNFCVAGEPCTPVRTHGSRRRLNCRDTLVVLKADFTPAVRPSKLAVFVHLLVLSSGGQHGPRIARPHGVNRWNLEMPSSFPWSLRKWWPRRRMVSGQRMGQRGVEASIIGDGPALAALGC